MRKDDVKAGTKVSAKDLDDGQQHRGQITRVTNSGYYIQWEHEQDETEHPFDAREYEQMEMID